MQAESLTNKEYAPFTVEVEKGRLRLFAKAIGESNPIYSDEEAAQRAGYPSILAPPTFAFTIAMDAEQPLKVIEDLGVDKTQTMHAEQHFSYHAPICAGDRITGRQRVVDSFEKKGGALRFIVTETRLQNQRQELVADLRTVIVIKQAVGRGRERAL